MESLSDLGILLFYNKSEGKWTCFKDGDFIRITGEGKFVNWRMNLEGWRLNYQLRQYIWGDKIDSIMHFFSLRLLVLKTSSLTKDCLNFTVPVFPLYTFYQVFKFPVSIEGIDNNTYIFTLWAN